MNTISFTCAKPVFIAGKANEMNFTAGFTCKFTAKPGSVYTLKMTASSLCRVTLDGEFCHYGPARAPHGRLRVDELTLNPCVGEHTLAFEVAGYNCPSFYSIKLVSLLCAEICEDGEVIAYTGRDFKGIALNDFREQRVPRYSYQRAFTEVYYLDGAKADWKSGDFDGDELEVIDHGCDYLPRQFKIPEFKLTDAAEFVRAGKYELSHKKRDFLARFLIPKEDTSAFDYYSCPNDIIDATDGTFTEVEGKSSTLTAGEFAEYKFPTIGTGFIRTKLTAKTPATVYVVFGEQCVNGKIHFGNGSTDSNATLNIIKYTLPEGEHTIESFEAYSFQYIGLLVESGDVELDSFTLREYCYPTKPFEPNTGDEELDLVLRACYNGFRQNTLDCFMDCPGRERGGWLCDSYFTAQASLYFTGDLSAEQAYLDNFRVATHFPYLPDGLLPMCYPGDVLKADTIPQWTMWYVAEVYEFGKRGGDVKPFEELIMRIFAYFEKFENSDGLLEKLPFWNFVEWTKANQWVQDVNYPTNMLYSYILRNTAEMYGRPDMESKADRIAAKVLEQSFDGEYFRDHAVRAADGTLIVCDDRSAICQHEAFMFGIADDSEKFASLKKKLIEGMGVTGDKSILIDKLEPLNLFIGYAVRVEVLMKFGCFDRNIEEIKALYGYMARDTGTIWEHDTKAASLNHGFGSFVAAKIAQIRKIN